MCQTLPSRGGAVEQGRAAWQIPLPLRPHYPHHRSLYAAATTHLIRLQRSILHVEIPDFDGQVVPGHQVASAVAELHIGDGRDDFRKERAAVWVVCLFKH